MSWRAPSLFKRLILTFILSFGVLVSAVLGAFLLAFDQGYTEVTIAATRVAASLVRDPGGGLVIARTPPYKELLAANPRLWAVAKASDGKLLVSGPAPPAAVGLASSAPESMTFSSALNFELPGPEPLRRTRLDHFDTPAGPVILVVGGVERAPPNTLLFAAQARGAVIVAAAPVLLVLGLVGWLIVAPLLLNGVRPMARAAARVDGSDPKRRLPEAGIMPELLPIVRSFNGALERLEQLLERRRRFMADAAHELRTPLAVLNMQVEDLPEGAQKADLQRGIFRLSQMVGQMLDAERLQGPGRRREAVDLVAMAREAAAAVTPLALEAGYDVEFATDAEAVTIQGDEPALKRAVTNLLGNAVAHGGGAGRIRVRVTHDATIQVADDGPGVPAADRERVFEPFQRQRWDRDGCGLGLHLVREIMTAHGGRAELAPSGERGACFRLVFPLPASQ